MGRYYYNRKPTAEESCRLTLKDFKRQGLLTDQPYGKFEWKKSLSGKTTSVLWVADWADNPCVILMYTITDRDGNKHDYKYEVPLVTTPCNFGGVRYWFACPCCYRRSGVLYLVPGEVYFMCRHCSNLTYRSRVRCRMEAFGHTCREIDKLKSEIKRWTWRGRPTRKARKLYALRRKSEILGGYAMARLDKLDARISGQG